MLAPSFIVDCRWPLGLQDGRVEDTNIYASSNFSSDFLPNKGRLNSANGWCASQDAINNQSLRTNQYIGIKFGNLVKVTGLAIQGSVENFVKSYKISYRRTDVWEEFEEEGVKVSLQKHRLQIPDWLKSASGF